MSTELTHSDVESILKIIDAAEHLNEIEIVHGSFRLHVVRDGGGNGRSIAAPRAPEVSQLPLQASSTGAPSPEKAVPAPAPPAVPADIPPGTIAIRAPMLGIFYRAPAPGEKPFVEVGQRVQADDTVCLIEVMKLFNSIRAGVDGEVVKICAENSGLVEFDQVLICVKPSKG
jgi:acetyl-CoA carboxylase biotin carboxyl carrier protein